MEKERIPLTQQAQTNAMVSYFFMALFVLMSRSSNFSHSFIKAHARYALFFHILIVLLLVSFYFTKDIRDIDVLNVSLKHVLYTIAFLYCLWGIIHWLYRASRGFEPSLRSLQQSIARPQSLGRSQLDSNLDETHAMIVIMAYVPYLGIILGTIHRKTREVVFAARASTVWMLWFIIIDLITLPGHTTLSTLYILVYIIAVAFRAVFLFFDEKNQQITLPFAFPSWSVVYGFFQALPTYGNQVCMALAGREKNLDMRTLILDKQREDIARQQKFIKAHQDETHLFSPYLVYTPLVNLIYIPTLLAKRDSRYYLAIWQGVMLSLLAIFMWWTQMSEAMTLLLVFPYILGLAHVKKTPAYRVIVWYELVLLIRWIFAFLPQKALVQKETGPTLSPEENTPRKESSQ